MHLSASDLVSRDSLAQVDRAIAILRTGPLYNITPEDVERVFTDVAFHAVVSSDAFRRLGEIQFLGAIDYLRRPNGSLAQRRHNRYQHSLAVGLLAIAYANFVELPPEMARIVVCAALLHDIGHPPLSHSLEPAFSSVLHYDHHIIGEKIIRGEIPIGYSLLKKLRLVGIAPNSILDVLNGKGSGTIAVAFEGPINLDTTEAITRAYSYISQTGATVSAMQVTQAVARCSFKDQDVLDEFWRLKHLVYSSLIGSREGILADAISRGYVYAHQGEGWQSTLLGTEKQLRANHKKLFDDLENFRASGRIPEYVSMPVRYKQRRFLINLNSPLRSKGDLRARYVQESEEQEIH